MKIGRVGVDEVVNPISDDLGGGTPDVGEETPKGVFQLSWDGEVVVPHFGQVVLVGGLVTGHEDCLTTNTTQGDEFDQKGDEVLVFGKVFFL